MNRIGRRRLGLSAVLAFLLIPSPALAVELVTSSANSGAGSLRTAITAADPGEAVVIDAGVNPILESAISIGKSLTVEGQGVASTEISAVGATRLFTTATSAANLVKFSRLTISGGRAPNGTPGADETSNPPTSGGAAEDGGAILNGPGTLQLSEVRFVNNAAGKGGVGGDADFGPGSGGAGGDGGAIANAGTLTIANSTFAQNLAGIGGSGGSSSFSSDGLNGAAGSGGAIFNAPGATLTITASTFNENEAAPGGRGGGGSVSGSEGTPGGNGGAIFNNGPLTVSATTFTANEAGAGGAGGSAILGGSGANGGSGGAVFSASGLARFTNTTFSANQAGKGGNGAGSASPGGGGDGGNGGHGGAIGGQLSSTTVVAASTFAGNSVGSGGTGASGGVSGEAGKGAVFTGGPSGSGNPGGPTFSIRGSLLSGNSGAQSCSGIFSDFGGNLVFPAAAGCPAGFTVADPKLDPAGLASNGGPTQTIALLFGSAALNLVPNGNCFDATGSPLTVDQRGNPRPDGGACDAGAWEGTPEKPRENPSGGGGNPSGGGSTTLAKAVASITKKPKSPVKTRKAKARVSFSFTSDQAGAILECKLDKRNFVPCKSPQSLKAKPGQHTFSVRAVNSAGAGLTATASFKVKRIKKKKRASKN